MLQKGDVLSTAQLSYKTLGQLNADRSNAVLVPSWYTGTHVESGTFVVGSDRALDRRGMVAAACPIAGSAQTGPFNKVFLRRCTAFREM